MDYGGIPMIVVEDMPDNVIVVAQGEFDVVSRIEGEHVVISTEARLVSVGRIDLDEEGGER